jgi:hypothetical protein
LYDNASVQFTHDNPLYAFDKISCERTTQFKLPSTPTNDRVFALARIPAYSGEGMRRKYDAQLQMGSVVRNGYLYVDSFDGKDYNAIFVTGELVGLQQIAQLGKISEIMTYDDTEFLNNYGISPQTGKDTLWCGVEYNKPNEDPIIPSIGLKQLYNTIAEKYELNVQAFPAELEGFRIVPAKANGIKEMFLEFAGTAKGMASDGTYPICYTSVLSEILPFGTNTARVEFMRIYNDSTPTETYSGSVSQLVAQQKISITFPDNWDDDLFVGYFEEPTYYLLSSFHFYGDRSFNEDHAISGESLKGRTIELEIGQAFTIIDISRYVDRAFSGGHERGWNFRGGVNIRDVIKLKGEAVAGSNLRLQDNLPDCTFVELCKTMAAIMGKVLNYSDSGYTNIITKLPIIETNSGIYDASTCTFTSTRTQNTNPNSNFLIIATYRDSTLVQQIMTQREIGFGSVTFTKTSNFNRLRVAFNGNNVDAIVYFDLSSLTDGTTYTLFCDVTILDRTNTGNDAQVSNLCLVDGSEIVTWNDWKNNQLGLSFDDLNFSEWQRKQDLELLKRGEVKRTFSDYGQNNIIRFESNDVVADNVTRVYVIQNDNIKAENVLQELYFSEGETRDNALYIRGENERPTIGGMTSGILKLTRVGLPLNSGLETLCSASTQFKIDVHMTALEYFGITAKTLIWLDGSLYTWTSRNWQKDKATFTLARL